METFSSKVFTLKYDINKVYDIISNPENLSSIKDKVGESFSQIENLTVSGDTITFKAPIGSLKFTLVEKEAPTMVKYQGEGTPVPLAAVVHLMDKGESTDVQLSMEAQIPGFMSGMIKGKVTPMLEQLATKLKDIKF